MQSVYEAKKILNDLDLGPLEPGAFAGCWQECSSGELLECSSPINGERLSTVRQAGPKEVEKVVAQAAQAFVSWRMRPAPERGEIVRKIGSVLRAHKLELGRLVSLEMGKILPEGEGEVQEMIDICDFAVGLSRQLYGLTIASERAEHRMMEQWHPLGVVGIITAFNFPVAVWAWNAALALVCGNTVVWKPSEKTPLTAIAVHKLIQKVLEEQGAAGVCGLLVGTGSEVGESLIRDPRVALVSMTGSTRVGRHVGEVVAGRFGRSLLELGGNNALIVMNDAPLDLALRAVIFGFVGTAGQRCTSTRRLFVQSGVIKELERRLLDAVRQVRIGNPLQPGVLMGPLIDEQAYQLMKDTIEAAVSQGARLLVGGERIVVEGLGGGVYVTPAVLRVEEQIPIMKQETFAPILFVMEVQSLDSAIHLQNDVAQGLSSAIFTDSMRTAEQFLSAVGSDCGIANVNLGTSGAEIGGAFGGEKETGGGRESGSDAWRVYMRRQTNTVNWGKALPLAQGIHFGET